MKTRISSITIVIQEVILYNNINLNKRSYIEIKEKEDGDNDDH